MSCCKRHEFHLDDQVNRELTIDGVSSAHCTRDFVYPNLVTTSYWHVKLDGMKFNYAAVETISYAIVDSCGRCWLHQPWT